MRELILLIRRMKANYRKLPEWERKFDAFLLVAVFCGAILAVLTHFISFSNDTLTILHSIDIAIFFVFILDLFIAYNRIDHFPTFIRHSWLDATVLLMGYFATSYMIYAGATRVNYLLKISKIHKIASFYHLGSFQRKFM